MIGLVTITLDVTFGWLTGSLPRPAIPAWAMLRAALRSGVNMETASTTQEIGAVAVTFVGVPATGALLRGIAGVNEDYPLTDSLGLVSEELLELVETPVVQLPVHARSPRALLHADACSGLRARTPYTPSRRFAWLMQWFTSVTNRLSRPRIRFSLRRVLRVPLDCNSARSRAYRARQFLTTPPL